MVTTGCNLSGISIGFKEAICVDLLTSLPEPRGQAHRPEAESNEAELLWHFTGEQKRSASTFVVIPCSRGAGTEATRVSE